MNAKPALKGNNNLLFNKLLFFRLISERTNGIKHRHDGHPHIRKYRFP